MALLISVNGTTEEVKPKNGSKFTLEELQRYVDGLIEFVYYPIKDNMKNCFFVVNEEGLICDLPYNVYASKMYMVVSGKSLNESRLHGDVLLVDDEEVN